jgi:hypothetical protein
MATGSKTPDKYARVGAMSLHPDPISKYGATRKGAGRVYGKDAKTFAGLPIGPNHLIHQGTLSNAGKAADPNHVCSASMRIKSS